MSKIKNAKCTLAKTVFFVALVEKLLLNRGCSGKNENLFVTLQSESHNKEPALRVRNHKA